jgi:hypothetical protein
MIVLLAALTGCGRGDGETEFPGTYVVTRMEVAQAFAAYAESMNRVAEENLFKSFAKGEPGFRDTSLTLLRDGELVVRVEDGRRYVGRWTKGADGRSALLEFAGVALRARLSGVALSVEWPPLTADLIFRRRSADTLVISGSRQYAGLYRLDPGDATAAIRAALGRPGLSDGDRGMLVSDLKSWTAVEDSEWIRLDENGDASMLRRGHEGLQWGAWREGTATGIDIRIQDAGFFLSAFMRGRTLWVSNVLLRILEYPYRRVEKESERIPESLQRPR